MMAYFALASADAKRYLSEREGPNPIRLDDLVRQVGDGEPLSTHPLQSLQEQLTLLQDEFPDKPSDQQGNQFERSAVERVHQAFCVYPPEVLGDPEFWIWVAVAWFADTIEWRFRSYPEPAALLNYGIGNRSENMIFRLWLRADLGYDAGLEDPYELAKVGDGDLWRSHIIRQGYANAREIVRALLLLQAGELGRARLERDDIRALAKELRRIRANVYLEVLSAAKARALVLSVCSSLGFD